MSTVSVIVPTWNRARELPRAIRSALTQTLPPLEVLVCDDGSTDGSREVVHALDDARVRWIPGPRGGRPAVPRNRGIRESRGQWLAFLDSDDQWSPEKIEEQIVFATATGCKAAASNAHRLLPGGQLNGPLLRRESGKLTLDELLCTNFVICSSAIIHSSLLSSVQGFPEGPEFTAFEDYALWLRVATLTDFAFLGKPLLRYTDAPQDSVRSASPDPLIQKIRAVRDVGRWSTGAGIGLRTRLKLRFLLLKLLCLSWRRRLPEGRAVSGETP